MKEAPRNFVCPLSEEPCVNGDCTVSRCRDNDRNQPAGPVTHNTRQIMFDQFVDQEFDKILNEEEEDTFDRQWQKAVRRALARMKAALKST
jgi:hypothetical protein